MPDPVAESPSGAPATEVGGKLLFDLSGIDLSACALDRRGLERYLPHRGVMMLLDALVWTKDDYTRCVGVKHVRDDEFWVRGHIPGRPLMPGVLIVESAGQLCGYFFERVMLASGERFFGFAGLDEVRFRGVVVPGKRLYLACRPQKMRSTSGVFDAQGTIDGEIVFDCIVKGMAIPK